MGIGFLVGLALGFPVGGLLGHMLALCSLPRTDQGKGSHFVRENGPFNMVMSASVPQEIPYGNLPRLLLAWVCSEAVHTGQRNLVLCKSLSDFMGRLGIFSTSGYGR